MVDVQLSQKRVNNCFIGKKDNIFFLRAVFTGKVKLEFKNAQIMKKGGMVGV